MAKTLNSETNKSGTNTFKDNGITWTGVNSEEYFLGGQEVFNHPEQNDFLSKTQASEYSVDSEESTAEKTVITNTLVSAGTIVSGGVVAGVAVGGVVATTVAVVAAAVSSAISVPTIKKTTYTPGFYVCEYAIDYEYTVDNKLDIYLTGNGKTTKELTIEVLTLNETKNEEGNYSKSLSGSFTGLTDNTYYTVDIKSNNGYGDTTISTTNFSTLDYMEPVDPTDPDEGNTESEYGTIALSSSSVDYSSKTISFGVSITDPNSYLSNIYAVATSSGGGSASSGNITGTSGSIDISGFTKGFYIHLEVYATSSHPLDIENGTTLNKYAEAVLYY
ncbi:MAG: hypothetical protein WCR97_03180 [Bacilli bacterium]